MLQAHFHNQTRTAHPSNEAIVIWAFFYKLISNWIANLLHAPIAMVCRTVIAIGEGRFTKHFLNAIRAVRPRSTATTPPPLPAGSTVTNIHSNFRNEASLTDPLRAAPTKRQWSVSYRVTSLPKLRYYAAERSSSDRMAPPGSRSAGTPFGSQSVRSSKMNLCTEYLGLRF